MRFIKQGRWKRFVRRLAAAAGGMLALAGAALGESAPPANAPVPAPAAAGGDGGLANLAAEDVQALRQTRDFLAELAADDNEAEDLRASAIASLNRIREALNDWGAPGLADWYLGLLKGARQGRVQGALLEGGQAAAKGGQYHLGGVREFWRKVDAMAAESGTELGRQVESQRKAFLGRAAAFDKPVRLSPQTLKSLALQVRRINLAPLVKPYPEPKPEKPSRQ